MSLPTAHSYLIETLMENLSSVEKNFLKPNMLLKHLTKTEKVLSEVVEVLSKKDFLEEIVTTQKEDIALLVQKLAKLEKASQGKLNWASQFSDYLQLNVNTK
jgi:predicted RNA-binding protein with EMAP domain